MTEREIAVLNYEIEKAKKYCPKRPIFWDAGNKGMCIIMPFFTIMLLLLTIGGSKTGTVLFIGLAILDLICIPTSIREHKEKMQKYNDIMSDLENYRLKMIKDLKEYHEKESIKLQKKKDFHDYMINQGYTWTTTKTNNTVKNIPKCPTCNSTDISDISTVKRAVGVATVGLASSDLGKTRKCNHCGYKW